MDEYSKLNILLQEKLVDIILCLTSNNNVFCVPKIKLILCWKNYHSCEHYITNLIKKKHTAYLFFIKMNYNFVHIYFLFKTKYQGVDIFKEEYIFSNQY